MVESSSRGRQRPTKTATRSHPEIPRHRTRHALGTVVDASEDAGAHREDVVRTRMYVVDADDWETIGEVHGEFFGDVRPVSTIVEGSSLIGPEYVIEVEAEAVLSE